MAASYTIEQLVPGDIDGLFEFRRRVLPAGPKQQDRQRWSWLYQENPWGDGRPACWVLKTEGRIAGSISAIIYRVRVRQEIVKVLHGSDFFVEEGFRGLPAVRLMKTMHAHGDLHVGTNYSTAAYRLCMQMGYVDLGRAFYCASTAVTGNRRLSWRLQLKSFWWKVLQTLEAVGGFQVRILDGVPADHEDLWGRIDQQRDSGLIKDRAFLNWRYEQCPGSPFSFIGCYRERHLRALAVFQVQPAKAGQTARGLICDLLVSERDRAALLTVITACLVHISRQGCSDCQLHSDLGWLRPVLSAIGFSTAASDLGFLVLVKRGAERLQPMLEPSAWSLALGDSDRY